MEQNTATELPQSSEWEVYQDTFAPPKPTHRAKPWERKPVSAHAPRLQGQKIWKKARSFIRNPSTKENGNAQTELDLEGMGARKRMKGIGEKENISDAKWLLHSTDSEIVALGNVSPVKKNGLDLGMDTNALLVPRKRTNANHLVTPRKPINKIPLQDVTQWSANKMDMQTKSGDMVDVMSPATTPARRTKSMRKSFRSVDEALSRHSKSTVITTGVSEDMPSDAELTTMSSQPVDIFGTSSEAMDKVQSELNVIEREILQEMDIDILVKENNGQTANIISQLDVLGEEEENFGSGQLQTELQENILPVISQDASISTSHTLLPKMDETPQKKLRSRTSRTPRGSPAVKRSNRVTRSSLALPETNMSSEMRETPNKKDLSFEGFSPVKAHPVSQTINSEVVETSNDIQESQSEADPTLLIDTEDTTAFAPPSEVLEEEPVVKSNVMEDIQQALSSEATEELESELPTITESELETPEDLLATSGSPNNMERSAPELPDHEVEQLPGSPVQSEDPSHSMEVDPESSEETDEEMEEIHLGLSQEVKSLADNNSIHPFELSSMLNTTVVVPSAVYDGDDADVLRNFLTRVKADKEAKANAPKRKKSLPHSPLQIPLGTIPSLSSPTSPKTDDVVDELALDMNDVSPSKISPTKRSPSKSKRNNPLTIDEPTPARRSGRTRLPVKSAPLANAPSLIPYRRLGKQAGDTTVSLKSNEEKELAKVTRINTEKNKNGAELPNAALKQAEHAADSEDPAAKHKALKEIFDEMTAPKKGNKKGRNVVWAEEIAQFQDAAVREEGEAALPVVKEEKKVKEKKPVVVGVRHSKIAVGATKSGISKSPAAGAKKQLKLKPKKK